MHGQLMVLPIIWLYDFVNILFAGVTREEFSKNGKIIESDKKIIIIIVINFLKWIEMKKVVKKNKINNPKAVLSPDKYTTKHANDMIIA